MYCTPDLKQGLSSRARAETNKEREILRRAGIAPLLMKYMSTFNITLF